MRKIIALFTVCAFMTLNVCADGVEFSQNGADIKIGAYAGEDKLDYSDRVAVFILKSGESFENDISEEKVYYANAARSFDTAETAEFTLSFDDNDAYGIYPARAAVTKQDGSVEFYDYEFIHMNDAAVASAIEEFNTAAQENFEMLFYKYTNEEIVLSKSNSALPKDNIGEFGKAFVIAREMHGDIKTLEDIYGCMELGQAVNAFLSGNAENVKTAVSKYGKLIEDFYDLNADGEKVCIVFKKLTGENLSAEEFKNNIKLACRLSYLQDVSNAEAAEYMEKNSAELGIDTEYMSKNNVSMLEAARYLDKTDAVKYKDGMGETIKKIVDDIVKSRSGGGTSKGNTQGGGGSKGGSITYMPAASVEKTENKTTDTAAAPYKDIDGFEWAEKQIADLTEKKILNGIGNGNFEPERKIFREEFAKIIAVAFGLDGGDSDGRFADSKIGDWFYPYVSAAAEAGIVNGIGDGIFGVGNFVSRQDAAVMCHRIMVKKNILPMYGMSLEFTDKGDVADYAAEAVSALESIGIINGFEDGSFKPGEGITRAQTAVIISRLMDFFEQEAK